MPQEKKYGTPAERQAAYRRRRREDPDGAPKDIFGYPLTDFWRSFPARPNDLRPTPEQLKKLGQTTGSR
jgi:hypothetical protein